ncbi:MAG: hypothetical protein U0326_42020 [Polyangiales bacterium]
MASEPWDFGVIQHTSCARAASTATPIVARYISPRSVSTHGTTAEKSAVTTNEIAKAPTIEAIVARESARVMPWGRSPMRRPWSTSGVTLEGASIGAECMRFAAVSERPREGRARDGRGDHMKR